MKTWIFCLTMSAVMITSSAYPETFTGPVDLRDKDLGDVTIRGPAQLKNVLANSLSVMGPLQYSNLAVSKEATFTGPVTKSLYGTFGKLKVMGPFEAKHTYCEEFEVTGVAQVEDLVVKNQATVIGSLQAAYSQFSTLTLTTEESTLQDCQVDSILVKKSGTGAQRLILKGYTVVNQSIVFESGNGKIVTNKNAQINGNTKGATVEVKD